MKKLPATNQNQNQNENNNQKSKCKYIQKKAYSNQIYQKYIISLPVQLAERSSSSPPGQLLTASHCSLVEMHIFSLLFTHVKESWHPRAEN